MSSRWLPKKDRDKIVKRDNCTCVYCEQTCIPATYPGMTRAQQIEHMRAHKDQIATIDHVIARYELETLGIDIKDPRYLVTACNACNSSKKHTRLELWIERKGLDLAAIIDRISQQTALSIA